MRVGILTLPLHINYGGVLQAFALQSFLESLGNNVNVIVIYDRFHDGNSLVSKLKRIIFQLRYNKGNVLGFVKDHIKTRKYKSFSSIGHNDFDAIVVGSDQIWRYRYVPYIENAFLQFTNGWNVKRISYAVSFGSDHWEINDVKTNRCKYLLSKFEAVSIREESGVELCKRYLSVEPKLVLDPTLLFDGDFYKQVFNLKNRNSNKPLQLFSYIINCSEEERVLLRWLDNNSEINHNSLVLSNCNRKCKYPSLNKWLQSIYEADYIITNSYHCAIFSILFHKKFVLVDDSIGSARLHHLLMSMELSSTHLVCPKASAQEIWHLLKNIGEPPPGTYEIIKQQRKESIAFLEDALH